MRDALQGILASTRRTQILEAAGRVFAEKGFHPSTVRDVARAAGVADGTIYNYFESKSALLLGLFDLMTERVRAQNDPAAQLDSAAQSDPKAQASLAATDLRGLLRLYLSGPLKALSADNAELFRVIVSEVMVNPEVRDRFSAQMLGPMLRMGESVFAQALTAQRVRSGRGADPAQVALYVRALSGLILGLLVERLIGDQTLQERWDELPDVLADLLTDGLLGGSEGTNT